MHGCVTLQKDITMCRIQGVKGVGIMNLKGDRGTISSESLQTANINAK